MPLQKIAVHPMMSLKKADQDTTDTTQPDQDKTDDQVVSEGAEAEVEAEAEAIDRDDISDRCDSQLSTSSDRQDICRICHCESEENNKLFSPCLCLGSLKYVHLRCLQKWIRSSDKKSCELCHFEYIMTSKTKPFREWERLDLSTTEKRKIGCSVTFHVIAITCVIWSTYVLLDRTTDEASDGNLDWPFWTKLIVVVIGFTGGLIFMYVQCKMYYQLVRRWRSFNKVIQIENVPENEEFRISAIAKIKAKMEENGGITNSVAFQEMDSF